MTAEERRKRQAGPTLSLLRDLPTKAPGTGEECHAEGKMLVGTVFVMPLIIGYTAWAYWVFRGKAAVAGYH